jgi:hypothetical protein
MTDVGRCDLDAVFIKPPLGMVTCRSKQIGVVLQEAYVVLSKVAGLLRVHFQNAKGPPSPFLTVGKKLKHLYELDVDRVRGELGSLMK